MSNSSINLKSPTFQGTIVLTTLAFISLLIMSAVLQLEVVAIGNGRVVPIGRVQVVQAEFSGKISSIHVQNGDAVQLQQVLISFDDTDAKAELNTLKADIAQLQIEAKRIEVLLGLLSGKLDDHEIMRENAIADFHDPDKVNNPYYIKQKELLIAEVENFASILELNKNSHLTNEKSQDVSKANIARNAANREIQHQRLQISRALFDNGTTSRTAYLDVEERYINLQNEGEILQKELEQKLSRQLELTAERTGHITSWRNNALQRRSEIEATLVAHFESQAALERRLQATRLRSPANGIVDRLNIHTIGGVASAGQEILRVVPSNQEFEIEAMLSNTDIGFVEIGQDVNIKFDAYPAERFGYLKGVVSDLSADAIELNNNQWGYAVRIMPLGNTLISGSFENSIRPGMTAEINIITDKRRIITYFFAPIVKTIQSALGER